MIRVFWATALPFVALMVMFGGTVTHAPNPNALPLPPAQALPDMKGLAAATCDFGHVGANGFRCNVGAGALVEGNDGSRVIVPGPLKITFGKL